jgi:hypothetical protein
MFRLQELIFSSSRVRIHFNLLQEPLQPSASHIFVDGYTECPADQYRSHTRNDRWPRAVSMPESRLGPKSDQFWVLGPFYAPARLLARVRRAPASPEQFENARPPAPAHHFFAVEDCLTVSCALFAFPLYTSVLALFYTGTCHFCCPT